MDAQHTQFLNFFLLTRVIIFNVLFFNTSVLLVLKDVFELYFLKQSNIHPISDSHIKLFNTLYYLQLGYNIQYFYL